MEYNHLTHWKTNFGRVVPFGGLSTQHLYGIIKERQQNPEWRGDWMSESEAKQAFQGLYAEARKRCAVGDGTVRVEGVPCCLFGSQGREGEFVGAASAPAVASGFTERKSLEQYCDGSTLLGTLVKVERPFPDRSHYYYVTLNVLPYMEEHVKRAMANPPIKYDPASCWKSADGRITAFELLDPNHLYNILAKRIREPERPGYVPEHQVDEVFTKLWKIAHDHCRHARGTVLVKGVKVLQPLQDEIGKWFIDWQEGPTYHAGVYGHEVTSRGISGRIFGTLHSIDSDGTVTLSVLPYRVDDLKKVMAERPEKQPQPQPQPQPTLQDALVRSRVDTLEEQLEREIAVRRVVMEDVWAEIRAMKLTLDAQRERLDDHGREIAARRAVVAHRNRLLWRLLPWVLTAAVGIGLGIANHYEGWIKLEIGNEAADR